MFDAQPDSRTISTGAGDIVMRRMKRTRNAYMIHETPPTLSVPDVESVIRAHGWTPTECIMVRDGQLHLDPGWASPGEEVGDG